MRRSVVGFHEDDQGDWVAELSCLHGQHVRHRPPFQERPWVLTRTGRAERIGTDLDCPLCDRAELPAELVVARTPGPFDARTLPSALRRDHRVAAGTWGVLRVVEGGIGFVMATVPPIDVSLVAGDRQPIPPGVPHHLVGDGPFLVAVDFLVRPAAG